MNTTKNRFDAGFDDDPTLDGGVYIKADLEAGVTVRAYVEHDPFTQPGDWADDAELAAWNRDEWRFCEMTLNVYLDGVCLAENAAALSGIAVGRDGDGEHLTEQANELLRQVDATGIVAAFAKRATAAARAMKKGGAR